MSQNSWILFGVLGRGPDRNDSFLNDRKNHEQANRFFLEYNAALEAGLLFYIDLTIVLES
jgi:hypothetical protein